jgi:hypothetical protein
VDRRGFIHTLTGGLLAAPLAVEADEGGHVLVEYRFARAKPNRLFEQSAGDLIQGTR